MVDDDNTRHVIKVVIGNCLGCQGILVGQFVEKYFNNGDSDPDEWTDVVRLFPRPPKRFSSDNIPTAAQSSLEEADLCIQAGANLAGRVMLGRALEAVCSHMLLSKEDRTAGNRITLGQGIKQ